MLDAPKPRKEVGAAEAGRLHFFIAALLALGSPASARMLPGGPAVALSPCPSGYVLSGPYCSLSTPVQAPPAATLHYAPNANMVNGVYAPGAVGYNLADVDGIDQLNSLPAGIKGLMFLGQTAGDTSAFEAMVAPFVGKANLWGFYLADDPRISRVPPANLMAEADYIHAHFPGIKVFVTLYNEGQPLTPHYDFNPANTHIDFFGPPGYASQRSLTNGFDIGVVTAAVSAANAAGIPSAQIVPVYQAFGGVSPWTMPTVPQTEQIILAWRQLVPNPAFDYTYSWGLQPAFDTITLANSPQLQPVYAANNAGTPFPDPPAPVITVPTGTVVVSNPTISGTANSGYNVTISIDGVVAGPPVTATNNAWSFQAQALGNGSHSVTAVAADPTTGRNSVVSSPDSFTVALGPPPVPMIISPANGSSVFNPVTSRIGK
ncbi:hypothetical protein SAMN05519104_7516 [Rhizobiales bacterium GAS188]|nr:hypothetical protein SAMN05519104_7516 [Rhizobiales bacterium GAS188]